jgi:hypothetical protein
MLKVARKIEKTWLYIMQRYLLLYFKLCFRVVFRIHDQRVDQQQTLVGARGFPLCIKICSRTQIPLSVFSTEASCRQPTIALYYVLL